MKLISLMTIFLFSFHSAFDHHLAVDDPSSFTVGLSLSNHFCNLKTFFGFVYGLDNFPFPTRLYGWLHCLHNQPSESSIIESSLALPHLYSSKMGFSESLSFVLRQYIATSMRLGGTPNHLLVNFLI